MSTDTEPADEPSPALEPQELPWRSGQVKRGPALLILAIVAVVAIGGFLLAALGSGHSGAPALGKKAAGIALMPAAPLLAPIVNGGTPPPDIVDSLALPTGAVRTSWIDYDQDLSTYDRSASFLTSASLGTLVSFYREELKRTQWSVESLGPTGSGSSIQLLEQRGGSDGNYWEVGITMTPINTSGVTTTNGSTPTENTRFVLRIVEEDDDN